MVLASVAMLAATAGLAGNASAQDGIFGRGTNDGTDYCTVRLSYASHWDGAVNPALVNEILRTHADGSCPKQTVLAGTIPPIEPV